MRGEGLEDGGGGEGVVGEGESEGEGAEGGGGVGVGPGFCGVGDEAEGEAGVVGEVGEDGGEGGGEGEGGVVEWWWLLGSGRVDEGFEGGHFFGLVWWCFLLGVEGWIVWRW